MMGIYNDDMRDITSELARGNGLPVPFYSVYM